MLYLLPKTLQRIRLNETERIKGKLQWRKILKFQYRFKITLNLTEGYSLETILT